MSLNRIGTAGWRIPKQYAKEFSLTGTQLERYSQVLSCAEINSTFYHSHRRSTWESWVESVPESFRFSIKAPKAITHEANLACGPEPLKIFLAEVNILGTKLGPILFQLPPKAAFDSTLAEAFFTLLREQHSGPTVLGPRHPSWFASQANHLLQKFHIARVAADPAITPARQPLLDGMNSSTAAFTAAPHVLLVLSGSLSANPRHYHREAARERNLVHL